MNAHCRGWVLVWALAATAAPAAADDAALGRELAAAGRCAEAIAPLERAVAANPQDHGAALADAQCRIALRRYDEARAILERLRAAGAGGGEVDLYLGIASTHAGDRAAADAALARARHSAPERAETWLYSGIVAFESGRAADALEPLETARAQDAARVEPMASYYLGVSRARLGQREAARSELEHAVAIQPDGPWAERARQELAALARAPAAPRRPWQLELGLGFEADDNVVLRGDDVALPEEISDEGDERLTWRAGGSAELWRGRAGRVGVGGDYGGMLHDTLHQFDVHYPAATLWWQRALGARAAARVEYRVGHAWVDERSFVTTHSGGPTFAYRWENGGRSQLRLRAFGFSYRDRPDDIPDGAGLPGDPCPPSTPPGSACGAPGVDESHSRDRSGAGYEIYAGHNLSLPWLERAIGLRPGLRFQHYFARGREVSYLRLEPRLGARVALPCELFLETDVSFAWRPYRGSSSLPEPGSAASGQQFETLGTPRRDRIWRYGVGLERELFDRVTAEARYSFLDNRSNHAIADYERHVVGVYLTVKLGG